MSATEKNRRVVFGNTVISGEGIKSENVDAAKTETSNFVGSSSFDGFTPFSDFNINPGSQYIPSTVVSPMFPIPSIQRFIYIKNMHARFKSFYAKITNIFQIVSSMSGSGEDYTGSSTYANRDVVYKKIAKTYK